MLNFSKFKRALRKSARVLEIAQEMVKDAGWQIKSRIEEIQIHTDGYAEPGYSSESGVIATGNWNGLLPERIERIFSKLEIECEWSDEWAACDDCGKLVRTESDSYFWKPLYVIVGCGYKCLKCNENE